MTDKCPHHPEYDLASGEPTGLMETLTAECGECQWAFKVEVGPFPDCGNHLPMKPCADCWHLYSQHQDEVIEGLRKDKERMDVLQREVRVTSAKMDGKHDCRLSYHWRGETDLRLAIDDKEIKGV